MTKATAEALRAGESPPDVVVAEDYPTEFSRGVAEQAIQGGEPGPYLIQASDGACVVGEIGGAFTEPGTVEIGYAVVRSRWGRGLATAAVRQFVRVLEERADVRRIVAHTPLDRPESARVVAKVGFELVGERDEAHDGMTLRVQRWVWLTAGVVSDRRR